MELQHQEVIMMMIQQQYKHTVSSNEAAIVAQAGLTWISILDQDVF